MPTRATPFSLIGTCKWIVGLSSNCPFFQSFDLFYSQPSQNCSALLHAWTYLISCCLPYGLGNLIRRGRGGRSTGALVNIHYSFSLQLLEVLLQPALTMKDDLTKPNVRSGITKEENATKIDGDNNPRYFILRNEPPQPGGSKEPGWNWKEESMGEIVNNDRCSSFLLNLLGVLPISPLDDVQVGAVAPRHPWSLVRGATGVLYPLPESLWPYRKRI